jgi:hypothetical protein
VAAAAGRGRPSRRPANRASRRQPVGRPREVDAPTARAGGETSRARNHTGSLGAALAWAEPTRQHLGGGRPKSHLGVATRRAPSIKRRGRARARLLVAGKAKAALAPGDSDSPPRPSASGGIGSSGPAAVEDRDHPRATQGPWCWGTVTSASFESALCAPAEPTAVTRWW